MSDLCDRDRVNASFVFGGKPLQVTESGDGWRVRYDGKDVEHAHLDHALAAALGWPPSSVHSLVRGILTGRRAAILGAEMRPSRILRVCQRLIACGDWWPRESR